MNKALELHSVNNREANAKLSHRPVEDCKRWSNKGEANRLLYMGYTDAITSATTIITGHLQVAGLDRFHCTCVCSLTAPFCPLALTFAAKERAREI